MSFCFFAGESPAKEKPFSCKIIGAAIGEHTHRVQELRARMRVSI
jgi:hypothetical protein